MCGLENETVRVALAGTTGWSSNEMQGLSRYSPPSLRRMRVEILLKLEEERGVFVQARGRDVQAGLGEMSRSRPAVDE